MSRIAIIGENTIEYIDCLLNIWNDSNCAVLIDWRIPVESAVLLMIEADVCKCYIDKNMITDVHIFADNNIEVIEYEPLCKNAIPLPNEFYRKFKPNYSNDEAIILYSSGTTGKSKGVILSHFAIQKNADSIIEYMHPQKADCVYIVKSLSHSSTLVGELLVALKTSMRLIVSPTIVSPRYVFTNIQKYNATVLCLNPTLLLLYIKEYEIIDIKPESLKTIYVSGAILSDKLYKQARLTFSDINLFNVYGLTEAGPRVSAQRKGCCVTNSVGKPIQGVDVRIIDEQGACVPRGNCGSILIRSPSLFSGYVTGSAKYDPQNPGWFSSGDIGYVDKYNELHVVDRSDNQVIIQAHNIFLNDIEQVIADVFGVEECVVVDYKDDNFECLCCAYTGNVEKQAIVNQIGNKLPSYEIPKKWIKLTEVPTSNDKPKVSDIRDLFYRMLTNKPANKSQ
ncbi:MAG: acyl--CoA ligase [Clostridiales bacterium]|nr:acyl--CoA ligase [Clostridiales bacterium]